MPSGEVEHRQGMAEVLGRVGQDQAQHAKWLDQGQRHYEVDPHAQHADQCRSKGILPGIESIVQGPIYGGKDEAEQVAA